jgi:hypothetical protein
MITRNGSNRRSFMKLLAASPLLAQITAKDLSAKSLAAVGLAKENPYTKIGVRTVINCRGTWTYLSGSLEFPEVREASIEAGKHFVNMVELQQGVGRKLAELTAQSTAWSRAVPLAQWQPPPPPAWQAPTAQKSGNSPTPLA